LNDQCREKGFPLFPELLYGTRSRVPTCQPRPEIFFLHNQSFFLLFKGSTHVTAEGLHFVLQFAQAGPNPFWHVCYS